MFGYLSAEWLSVVVVVVVLVLVDSVSWILASSMCRGIWQDNGHTRWHGGSTLMPCL